MKKLMKSPIIMMLILAIVINLVAITATATNGTDVSDIINNSITDIDILQDGKSIWDEDVELNTGTIGVNLKFNIPVIGDGNDAQVVSYGDYAFIEIARGFITPNSEPLELYSDTRHVGHITLETIQDSVTGQSVVRLRIDFDGDQDVFEGEWGAVNCIFNCELFYDGEGEFGGVGEHEVAILDKTFVVGVTTDDIQINGTKTGTQNNQTIDWVVKVEATMNNSISSLNGYQFYDDLKYVGDYIADSFYIGSSSHKTEAIQKEPVYNDGVLSYMFDEDASQTQYVFFSTRIDDDVYYKNQAQTVSNTALIRYDDVTEATFYGSVTFDMKWITKTGSTDTNGMITWTILINEKNESLSDVVIKDILNSKVDWVSASLYEYRENQWVDSSVTFASEPTDGKYALGDIDCAMKLVIKSQIQSEYLSEYFSTSVSNQASVTWGEVDATLSSSNVNVSLGKNPLSKSGGTFDQKTLQMPWTVKLDELTYTDNDDFRILDLIVYGNSNIKAQNYTVKNNANSGTLHISEDVLKMMNSYQKLGQKYVDNSFTTDSPIQLTVYQLVDDNEKAVADLLVVTHNDGTSLRVDSAIKYTYKTQLLDPNKIVGKYANTNSSTTRNFSIENIAVLLNGDTYLTRASSNKTVTSNLIEKDMITVHKAQGDLTKPSQFNGSGSAAGNAYNYVDRSVVFRINVNLNGTVNLSDVVDSNGTSLGKVTVTDVLPAGWEFKEFSDEQVGFSETITDRHFLLFEASPATNNSKYLNATEYKENPDFITVNYSTVNSVEQVSFEFDHLDGAYVILLKAGPTDEIAQEYFSKNQTIKCTNDAILSCENWSTTVNDWEDVTISSQLVNKSLPNGAVNGVLTWHVNYKPYDLGKVGARIVDVLPVGAELKMNADGTLNIDNGTPDDLTDDNIKITELILQPNGSYVDGNQVQVNLGQDGNVTYDHVTRELVFLLADPNVSYRFEYNTIITANVGAVLTNKVTLTAQDDSDVDSSQVFRVSTQDATATMQYSGWVKLFKENQEGLPLANVKFAVYAIDGTTLLRTGLTDENGILYLRGLYEGEYILREIETLEGYVLPGDEYYIQVTNKGDSFMTSINNKEGNELVITNYSKDVTGQLNIKKELSGDDTEINREFEFEITLSHILNGYLPYKGLAGKTDGMLEFVNGVAQFTLKGNESITITELPEGIEYIVTEMNYEEERYETTYTNNHGEITSLETSYVVITNSRDKEIIPEPEVIYTQHSVVKLWNDSSSEVRPLSIRVQLFRDGIKFGDEVILSVENGFSYTWNQLDTQYTWTVDEVGIPAGYTKTISTHEQTTVITNTKIKTVPDISFEPEEDDGDYDTLSAEGKEEQKVTLTSDITQVVLYVGLFAVSLLACVFLLKKIKK